MGSAPVRFSCPYCEHRGPRQQARPLPHLGTRPLTCVFSWSGCRDSNPGPSVPQTDALTKLRHSP